MEKDFAQLNYYEMLDVKPDATALEIRSAYNAACKYINLILWLVILFFAEERKKIITLLERAYFTLINEKEREIYDNELIRLGILNSTEKNVTVKVCQYF